MSINGQTQSQIEALVTSTSTSEGNFRTGLNHIISQVNANQSTVYEAEGWVTYSGSTPTLKASNGFASVSNNSNISLNWVFTTPQPDTDYLIEMHIQHIAAVNDLRNSFWVHSKSTTGFSTRFTNVHGNVGIYYDHSVNIRRIT